MMPPEAILSLHSISLHLTICKPKFSILPKMQEMFLLMQKLSSQANNRVLAREKDIFSAVGKKETQNLKIKGKTS